MALFTKKFTFEEVSHIRETFRQLLLYPIDRRKKIIDIAERIIMDNKDYLSTHCFIINDQIYLKHVPSCSLTKKEEWCMWHYDNLMKLRLWLSVGFGVKLGKKQIITLLKKCAANGYFPEETEDKVNAVLVMRKLVYGD